MFRLEKLEIAGFKSFYDPAELVFPSPLTAVVGPNGCGKSNICDAISWVLGEQRASHIRGETMEDVIFQGSERRRALGMGEVTLTLATDNGHPSAEDGRITINRRVFRDGESEFRLNGKRVRLKDIADILMDTGLGIKNYAVMEQGKIDLILSNKPQDRRRLIEEAAGITRYKSKRRAAELKLEETQANLVRIDDTLSEVTRNLNSLKRQASKARRHQEVVEALSSAKRTLYAARILGAREEQSSAEQALAGSQAVESESAATLARHEAELAETRTLLADRAARASRLREEITRTDAQAERLRAFLEQSETNRADVETRSQRAAEQIAEIESESAEQRRLLGEREVLLQEATAERQRLQEVSDDLERTRQQNGDAVRSAEQSLGHLREELMRTIARISEARNQVHQIEIAAEKCEFYLGKLGDTTRRVTESRESMAARLQEWNSSTDQAQEQVQQTQHRLREARDTLDRVTQEREQVRTSLANARDVISQTTYRIDSLKTLLISLESQDEEIRRALVEILPAAASAAESVRAAEGLEAALDAVLRDITKAVVVEDSATAVEAVKRIRERGAGRGTFIRLDFRAASEQTAGGNIAGAIEGEGTIADAVRGAAPEAYIVDSLEEALDRAPYQPHAAFVTRDGDIVRGPLVSGGRAENARGIFTVKRQLRDLEQLVSEEEVRAADFAERVQRLEDEHREADDQRILAEERVKQAEMELRERLTQRERFAVELQRVERDLEAASEELALYSDEKEQLLTRRDSAIAELRAYEDTERDTQEQIRSTEDRLVAARREFESVTEVAGRARVDLEAAAGRLNAAAREHENLARIVASLEARDQQLREEVEALTARGLEIDRAVDDARSQLDESLRSLTDLNEQRVALEAEVADTHSRVAELERLALDAREAWNSQRSGLFEAERRLDRAKSAVDLLREQILLDLHAGLESFADVAPPENDEERERLEQEVARLSDQLEKIGPVNVLAIEEYRELEERETFLRTQRDDLVQSIESLRSTIRKINMTSRELFRDAFTAINASFGEIFTTLFGGGRAVMQLLDEEDILESGIELAAQPPGKKTNSIALLSGGERALTALALLFAIFRYKPSPFCILDEVDAPLDEVNNERFVRLLRDMARDTQFIVITHSKRTMEAADVLYGVTMEEAGCSRLVSVSFADLEA